MRRLEVLGVTRETLSVCRIFVLKTKSDLSVNVMVIKRPLHARVSSEVM